MNEELQELAHQLEALPKPDHPDLGAALEALKTTGNMLLITGHSQDILNICRDTTNIATAKFGTSEIRPAVVILQRMIKVADAELQAKSASAKDGAGG